MEIGPLREIVVLFFALVGTVFMLISGIGLVRLPDVFARMHAAGMASTLGMIGLLLAAGVYFYDQGHLSTMIALIVLFFVTAPIASTTMARAAYRAASKYADNEDGDQAEQDFHLRFDDLAQATPSVPSSQPTHPTP